MTSEDRILTVAQVAARIGFAHDVVLDLCDRGELEGAWFVTRGARRHWRIPAEAVEAWKLRSGYEADVPHGAGQTGQK